jgi:hypothetical protein
MAQRAVLIAVDIGGTKAAVPGQVDALRNMWLAGNLSGSDAPFREQLWRVFYVPS